MAKQETDIVVAIMKALSPLGVRLFKNVRGRFYTMDKKRIVSAGLQMAGASDLIGYKIVTITPDMVGKKFAQFLVIEAKSENGTTFDDQDTFIETVDKNGGLSGAAWSVADALEIAGLSDAVMSKQ